jgi:hypothetical protein
MNKETLPLKTLQRVYRDELTLPQHEQLVASMPQWVTAMGLEWLHELLLKIEILLKGKAPRQS